MAIDAGARSPDQTPRLVLDGMDGRPTPQRQSEAISEDNASSHARPPVCPCGKAKFPASALKYVLGNLKVEHAAWGGSPRGTKSNTGDPAHEGLVRLRIGDELWEIAGTWTACCVSRTRPHEETVTTSTASCSFEVHAHCLSLCGTRCSSAAGVGACCMHCVTSTSAIHQQHLPLQEGICQRLVSRSLRFSASPDQAACWPVAAAVFLPHGTHARRVRFSRVCCSDGRSAQTQTVPILRPGRSCWSHPPA